MKYVRLLKDTPEWPAGTVFKKKDSLFDSFYQVVGSSTDEGFSGWIVKEKLGEWFEEVVQVFVRPFNADKLAKLDKLANGDDVDIADHFLVERVSK